jgi:predicted DsbA family dithiol-disulfide isomerase
MRLLLFHDPICPWCRIGRHHLRAALATSGAATPVTLQLHPFLLNPDLGPEGTDFRAYLAAKFGAGSYDGMTRRLTELGTSLGLPFAFDDIRRIPDSKRIHALVAALPEAARFSALAQLQDAYFAEGADVGAESYLVELAARHGLDAASASAAITDPDRLARVRAQHREALEAGVSGVPCLIIDDRFAVTGAQPPEVLQRAFERATR